MGKFISLFAGVGGFDLGMELAGHECVAQVEWDKNAAGVLKRRWPDVPLFCDVSRVSGEDLPDCDFLTYGFPCQDLSVAGKREGLSGERSGLFFEATRLIRELRARGSGIRFALAENVAGLFSADDGRAFARCIGELLESGASEIGWRMFDSQYFGVPQRRKRVFIVSDFGGRSCDEIFAITESLPGYPAPSRESGKGIAGDVEAGIGKGSERVTWPEVSMPCMSRDYKGPRNYQDGGLQNAVVQGTEGFTPGGFGGYERGCGTLRSQGGDLGGGSETLLTQGADVYNGELTGEVAPTVTSATGISNASGPKVMGFKQGDKHSGVCGGLSNDLSPPITNGQDHQMVCHETPASGPKAISWNGYVTPKASVDVSVTLRSQQGGEGVGLAFQKSELRLKDKIELNEVSPTLNAETKQGDTEVSVVHAKEGPCYENHPGDSRVTDSGETCPTITKRCGTGGGNLPFVRKEENLTVRRLTPKECERLQGFPDEWTIERMELELVDNEWKPTGKVIKQTDGPRYKQMGNAVTVNVAYWLGKRMGKVIDE